MWHERARDWDKEEEREVGGETFRGNDGVSFTLEMKNYDYINNNRNALVSFAFCLCFLDIPFFSAFSTLPAPSPLIFLALPLLSFCMNALLLLLLVCLAPFLAIFLRCFRSVRALLTCNAFHACNGRAESLHPGNRTMGKIYNFFATI